jgi:hypothetical protein
VAGKVWMPPLQLSGRQPVLVDHARQAPAPLHVPSFEQSPPTTLLFTQRDFGSAPPLSTAAQVPAALVRVPLQVLHRPSLASAHALLQHTPSVQKPLWHWLAAVQAAPFTLRPHEPFTQVLGGTQSCASVAAVQLVLHEPFAQSKVPHETLAGVTHLALPSQVEAGVSEAWVAHAAALQLRPAG